jgi:hypothetical protein
MLSQGAPHAAHAAAAVAAKGSRRRPWYHLCPPFPQPQTHPPAYARAPAPAPGCCPATAHGAGQTPGQTSTPGGVDHVDRPTARRPRCCGRAPLG